MKFLIGTKLGSGGFAEVFECTRDDDNSIHALKRLRGGACEEDIKRFAREVRIQSALQHPHIVSIIAMNLKDSPPWFVMPKATMSLRQYITSGHGEDKLWVVWQIASALAHAHANGIIHRDLKPENVLLFAKDDGTITWKLSDFGLGRLVSRDSPSLTVSNIGMGTFEYMAPEQYRNAKNVDVRADVFALGRILYEILTGEIAFPTPDLDKVPPKLRYLVRKATENDPDCRYQTVGAFADDLAFVTRKSSQFVLPAVALRQSLDAIISDDDHQEEHLAAIVNILLDNLDDEIFLTTTLPSMPEPVIRKLLQGHLNEVREVMRAYDASVSGGLPFEYCDTVANFYFTMFNLSNDREIRLIILNRLPALGYSHNRYHVRRVVARILASLDDPELLMEVRTIFHSDSEMAEWFKETLAQYSLPPLVREELSNIEPVEVSNSVREIAERFFERGTS